MFKIDNMVIRDEQGRERIFRGINICYKNVHYNEKEIKQPPDFDYLSSIGVNLVRLGFTWAMLEPKENEYDEDAFQFIKGIIESCGKRNIYVILDTHQDLFYCNKGVGDGAPKWITKDYKEKGQIAVWAEGYFYANDVQRAFNDFWSNKNGMQDKFVRFWTHVKQELGGFDNIFAFDYFNEPLVNNNSNKIFCTIINNACKHALKTDFDAEKYYRNGREYRGFISMALAIAIKIKSIRGLKKFLNAIDDYETFGKLTSGVEKYTSEFESKYYQDFIIKMANEIGDNEHFNLLEHGYYNNLGVKFNITPASNSIYSPHAYDIFIDSPLYNKYSSNERIRYILDGIRDNQKAMNLPVIMGEWGGGAKGYKWIDNIDYIYGIIERNHWSSLYWGYRFKNKKFLHTMDRPYPVAVNGNIVRYKTDSKSRTFELEYICEENNCKTIIFIPKKGMTEFDNEIGTNIIKLNY